MTAEKRYVKRIGWVVVTRNPRSSKWSNYHGYSQRTTQKSTIKAYNKEFFNGNFKTDAVEDFARLEAVYVEVQDG